MKNELAKLQAMEKSLMEIVRRRQHDCGEEVFQDLTAAEMHLSDAINLIRAGF